MPALNADLQTSLLFITTLGAFAVGGALSVTTVLLTVLFVCAAAFKLIMTKTIAQIPAIIFCIGNSKCELYYQFKIM
jgi:hypothetical protein